jgi:hypothetical protein
MNFLIFGGVLRWLAYLRGQDTYRSRYSLKIYLMKYLATNIILFKSIGIIYRIL